MVPPAPAQVPAYIPTDPFIYPAGYIQTRSLRAIDLVVPSEISFILVLESRKNPPTLESVPDV